MTQTVIANSIVNALLGWLKGLAGWVLRLFNLSGGASPLQFLANNWKILLIILLAVGVGTDLIVWVVRWRPHWVWFHKKRIVINDENFFKEKEEPYGKRGGESSGRRVKPKQDWVDSEYVVPSTMVKRRKEVRNEPDTRKKRTKSAQHETAREHRDVFSDSRFNVNAKQRFTDKYEDEIFDVSDLPDTVEHRDSRRGSVKRPDNSRRNNTYVPKRSTTGKRADPR